MYGASAYQCSPYPAVAVLETRYGRINHIDDLATSDDKAIEVPNNDTLYSSGWYDLRHGDLVIDGPHGSSTATGT